MTMKLKRLSRQYSAKKTAKVECNSLVRHSKEGDRSFRECYNLKGRNAMFPKTHQCLHRASGNMRSVKILQKTTVDENEFLTQVNILQGLDHPNLINLYETFEDDKFYYLVTDYLNHNTLFQAVALMRKQGEEFTKNHVAHIVATLLEVLNYCHEHKQTAHGSIHPNNILVPEDDQGFSNLMLVGFDHAAMKRADRLPLLTRRRNPGLKRGRSERNLPKRRWTITDIGETEDLLRSSFRLPRRTPKRSSTCESESGIDNSTGFSDSTTAGEESFNMESFNPRKIDQFTPPEFMEEGPTPKGDIFSVGVLTYIMLTGKFPFRKQSEVKDGIQNWHNIEDQDTRDFIAHCLQFDPTLRPTAYDAYDYDWMACGNKVKAKLDPKVAKAVLGRLVKPERKKNKLQLAVAFYIATNLVHKAERANLDLLFKQADRNNDGVLTKGEIKRLLEDTLNTRLEVKEMDKIYAALSTKGDDTISHSEFLAAAAGVDLFSNETHLKAAFTAFYHQDDKLSFEEFKHLVGCR